MTTHAARLRGRQFSIEQSDDPIQRVGATQGLHTGYRPLPNVIDAHWLSPFLWSPSSAQSFRATRNAATA